MEQGIAELGLNAHATFSGSLVMACHFIMAAKTGGLVEEGFRNWQNDGCPSKSILMNVAWTFVYEFNPGEDCLMGLPMKCFLEKVNITNGLLLYDPSHFVLQQLDYLQYIDFYHERIKAFHVKRSEFMQQVSREHLAGYQSWIIVPAVTVHPVMGRLILKPSSVN